MKKFHYIIQHTHTNSNNFRNGIRTKATVFPPSQPAQCREPLSVKRSDIRLSGTRPGNIPGHPGRIPGRSRRSFNPKTERWPPPFVRPRREVGRRELLLTSRKLSFHLARFVLDELAFVLRCFAVFPGKFWGEFSRCVRNSGSSVGEIFLTECAEFESGPWFNFHTSLKKLCTHYIKINKEIDQKINLNYLY